MASIILSNALVFIDKLGCLRATVEAIVVAMKSLTLVSLTALACQTAPPPDWCGNEAPDEACFRQTRPIDHPNLVRAQQIAAAFMHRHPATELKWGWEDGVLLTALSELHRVTQDSEIEQYLKDYRDHHQAESVAFEVSDDCPPVSVAAYLGGYDSMVTGMNQYLSLIHI